MIKNPCSRLWIVVFAGVLTLAGGCRRGPQVDTPRPAAGATADHPNIVFILVDTLRADRLGCYGDPRGLSPTMDALASEGVLFERTIATAPWTLPSVASFFCGYYPSVHKVTSYQEALRSAQAAGKVRYFGEQFTTLAEVLRDNGYQTAGFSANPFVTAKFGFAQGFEHFDSSFAANTTPGRVVNAAALEWLRKRETDKPFFLYLHYMDVHDPYKADAKYVEPLVDAVRRMPDKRLLTPAERKRHGRFFGKSAVAYRDNPRHRELFRFAEYWRARYDAGVPQASAYLADLRGALQRLGLWESAFVILTADHGEALGAHRIWAHGLSAHQDQLHVPLILRWPGHLPAGARIRRTVRLFDVMPTILNLVGISPPDGIQARTLAGLIRTGGGVETIALAEAVKQRPREKALVAGKWKLLAYPEEKRYELYDLDADPGEQHDLAAVEPDQLARLRGLLERQLKENAALGRGVKEQSAEISAQERARFQALGYFEEHAEDENAGEDQTSQPASPGGGHP